MAPARFDRYSTIATVVLSSLFCLALSGRAGAAESAALQLLRTVQKIQASNGLLAPQQVPPLLELGWLYSGGQCEHAIELLDLALEVSRRNEGLFNLAQLDIYEPLLNCYVTLELPDQVQQAQQYILLIGEQRYGRKDLRLLPTLEQGARRYEEVGLYLSARKFHRRAIDIARRAAGDRDLSLVRPLRGMARAFRLEYTYGLALPDLIGVEYDTSGLGSRATFGDSRGAQLDRLGQRSLEQAVAILRSHPDADTGERFATLLDLGDWYQIDGDPRAALRTYRELWNAGGTELLSVAEPLFTRPESAIALRRPPVDAGYRNKYTIDLQYTVTRDGRAKDITVIESNAPRVYRDRARLDLERAKFRPRFVDGEPVDATGMHHRQNIYARK